MPIDLRSAPPNSPEWWLVRLLGRLSDRVPAMARFDDYYNGIQPLAFASDKFKEAFGDRFRAFSSNFMALVVDGTSERLEVTGFRFKDPEGDKDLWKIWQENDLDAGSQLAHTEALVKGLAYALVEPDGADTPRITIEDPLDCIVEHDPRVPRRRVAALKRWIDAEGHMVVYVYLPDFIYKYRSEQSWSDDFTAQVKLGIAPSLTLTDSSWVNSIRFSILETAGENWPLANPLGTVPIVSLPNRPRLKLDGQSELASITSNQDAINKYRADALVAAEYAAFRQRWAIGLDVPIDPDTGQEIEPFKAAVNHLWIAPPPDPNDPNPPDVRFGEFAATDLTPYKTMIELEVDHISHVARMPAHELLGQTASIPASGEAIKSAETGLLRKVGKAMIHLGDGWEETMRLALRAMGDARSHIRDAETIWRNPETRNEAVITDAVVKLWTANGGPNTRPLLDNYAEAYTILGFSPATIVRLEVAREAAEKARKAEEAALAVATAAAAPPPVAPRAPVTRTFARDATGAPAVRRNA